MDGEIIRWCERLSTSEEPDNANAHLILGSLDLRAKDYEAAKSESMRAISSTPT